MGHLPDYLSWRGDLPFSLSPRCDIDLLVFAVAVYLDLPKEGILRACAEKADRGKNTDHFHDECCLLMAQLGQSERFGDLMVRDAVSVLNDEVQFAAMTIDLPDGSHVVAFRGTDGSETGWREDFAMSFESPVPAQAAAQAYLTCHLQEDTGDFLVTGHSKGGNLAVYAAAHTPAVLQPRLKRIVSFDGPGVDDDTAASAGYEAVTKRIIAYVPQFAVVGLLLAAHPVHRVVQSSNFGIMQHDPFSWEMLGRDFCYAEGLDKRSMLVNQTVHQWLAQCSKEQRRQFVDGIFTLLSTTKRVSLKDVIKDIPGSLTAVYQADKESAKMVAVLLGKLAAIGAENTLDMIRQNHLPSQEAGQNKQEGAIQHE